MKKIFLLLFFMLTTACAQTPKKMPAEPAPESAVTEFNKLKSTKSVGALEAFANKYANTDLADDAYILIGKIHCSKADYQNCANANLKVINSQYISPSELDAVIGASKALLELDRNDEVIGLTLRGIKSPDLQKSELLTLYNYRLQALAKTGDRLEAIRALAFLSQNASDEKTKEKHRLNAIELISTIEDIDSLSSLAKDTSLGDLRIYALHRAGIMEFEARDYSDAADYLEDVVAMDAESNLAFSAKNLLQQIEARRRVDPLTIGAVLPLSGRYKAIGYKTLRGLELGLGITGQSNSNFKLAVVDSVGNPDIARRGVERLVVEDSAIAVVGDISSRSADAVATKADELGLPNISLAQKTGLENPGPYIFRNALTSEALVKELVRAAMEDQGMKTFAILYPNDPYGVEYANIFWDEVKKRGGEIRGVQAYDVSSRNFGDAVRRLVGTYYVEPREEELKYLIKDWYSKQKVIHSRTKAPDDLLKPIVDFDAIFVPDSLSNLAQVASMLIYNDINNVRLLGTNLWNTSGLVKKGTKLIKNSVFVDAASSVSDNLKNSRFYQNYVATYGEAPSIFEVQAYDTGLALRQAIASGARSRGSLRDALLRLNRFPGAIGEVSIEADQQFSRPLVALTVEEEEIIPLAKKPEISIKK